MLRLLGLSRRRREAGEQGELQSGTSSQDSTALPELTTKSKRQWLSRGSRENDAMAASAREIVDAQRPALAPKKSAKELAPVKEAGNWSWHHGAKTKQQLQEEEQQQKAGGGKGSKVPIWARDEPKEADDEPPEPAPPKRALPKQADPETPDDKRPFHLPSTAVIESEPQPEQAGAFTGLEDDEGEEDKGPSSPAEEVDLEATSGETLAKWLLYNVYAPHIPHPLAAAGSWYKYLEPNTLEYYWRNGETEEIVMAEPPDWDASIAYVPPLAALTAPAPWLDVGDAAAVLERGPDGQPQATWYVYRDLDTLTQFFYEHTTGYTRWSPPADVRDQVIEGPGAKVMWNAGFDDGDFNVRSNVARLHRSWTTPYAGAAPEGGAAQPGLARVRGWEVWLSTDEGSEGILYYYNRERDLSEWAAPEEVASAPAPEWSLMTDDAAAAGHAGLTPLAEEEEEEPEGELEEGVPPPPAGPPPEHLLAAAAGEPEMLLLAPLGSGEGIGRMGLDLSELHAAAAAASEQAATQGGRFGRRAKEAVAAATPVAAAPAAAAADSLASAGMRVNPDSALTAMFSAGLASASAATAASTPGPGGLKSPFRTPFLSPGGAKTPGPLASPAAALGVAAGMAAAAAMARGGSLQAAAAAAAGAAALAVKSMTVLEEAPVEEDDSSEDEGGVGGMLLSPLSFKLPGAGAEGSAGGAVPPTPGAGGLPFSLPLASAGDEEEGHSFTVPSPRAPAKGPLGTSGAAPAIAAADSDGGFVIPALTSRGAPAPLPQATPSAGARTLAPLKGVRGRLTTPAAEAPAPLLSTTSKPPVPGGGISFEVPPTPAPPVAHTPAPLPPPTPSASKLATGRRFSTAAPKDGVSGADIDDLLKDLDTPDPAHVRPKVAKAPRPAPTPSAAPTPFGHASGPKSLFGDALAVAASTAAASTTAAVTPAVDRFVGFGGAAAATMLASPGPAKLAATGGNSGAAVLDSIVNSSVSAALSSSGGVQPTPSAASGAGGLSWGTLGSGASGVGKAGAAGGSILGVSLGRRGGATGGGVSAASLLAGISQSVPAGPRPPPAMALQAAAAGGSGGGAGLGGVAARKFAVHVKWEPDAAWMDAHRFDAAVSADRSALSALAVAAGLSEVEVQAGVEKQGRKGGNGVLATWARNYAARLHADLVAAESAILRCAVSPEVGQNQLDALAAARGTVFDPHTMGSDQCNRDFARLRNQLMALDTWLLQERDRLRGGGAATEAAGGAPMVGRRGRGGVTPAAATFDGFAAFAGPAGTESFQSPPARERTGTGAGSGRAGGGGLRALEQEDDSLLAAARATASHGNFTSPGAASTRGAADGGEGYGGHIGDSFVSNVYTQLDRRRGDMAAGTADRSPALAGGGGGAGARRGLPGLDASPVPAPSTFGSPGLGARGGVGGGGGFGASPEPAGGSYASPIPSGRSRLDGKSTLTNVAYLMGSGPGSGAGAAGAGGGSASFGSPGFRSPGLGNSGNW